MSIQGEINRTALPTASIPLLRTKTEISREPCFLPAIAGEKREGISSESLLGCRNSPTHKFSSPSARLATETAKWAKKLIYHIKLNHTCLFHLHFDCIKTEARILTLRNYKEQHFNIKKSLSPTSATNCSRSGAVHSSAQLLPSVLLG